MPTIWLAIYGRSGTHLTLLALVIGLVIGLLGHLSRSRWLILLGIAIIAAVSVLFSVLVTTQTS